MIASSKHWQWHLTFQNRTAFELEYSNLFAVATEQPVSGRTPDSMILI